MQGNNAQSLLIKNIPYDIPTLFTQLYQNKCFEVNLKRALLMENYSNLPKVNIINAYWFSQWKKVSCYEAIKDELNIYCSCQENFQSILNNYYKVVQKINIDEKLDKNIDNNYLAGEYDDSIGGLGIDEECEFDIISKELWDCFVPQNSNNINNGTSIELKLETLTKDSLLVNLNKTACYIIYWNREEEKLGKLLFLFDNISEKNQVLSNIKNMDFTSFYACNLDDLKDEKEFRNSAFKFKCINKSQRKLSYEDFKKSKIPVGLDNVGMSCYMNAALQSLYNTPKLTSFFLHYKDDIRAIDNTLSISYLDIVLNLSRKAKGSKTKSSYSPRRFFDIIKTQIEFQDPAGDSIDLIRFFMEKMHNQLMGINNQELNPFKNYFFIINNSTDINICFMQQINNLNTFISTYGEQNKSIIANTFYFIEKSQIKCCNCQYVTANFSSQMYLAFPLEEVRKDKIYNYINNNINNNPAFNGMINNNNFMNNNMNMMQMNNYMNMMQMNNNMNMMPMNNNMIMAQMNNNMISNNMNFNIPNINSVTLEECFEFYNNKKTQFTGTNQIICKGCNYNTNAIQWNSIYSLPDVLVINLNRGKGNKFNVGITFPEEIDLKKYVEDNKNYNNIYKLKCIVTHLGPSGTSGHYIAFCYVQNKNKWYKFDDTIVSESSFQDASTFGDSYILFYQRKDNQLNN